MPDPISRAATVLPNTVLEPALREITGARPDASLAPHPHDESTHVAITVAEGVAAGAHAVGEAGALFALEAIGGLATAPLGWLQWINAHIEGDRLDLEAQGEVLRGGLAVLEGRRDDVETLREMERNPGFAQGVRAAEQYYYSHPAEFAAACEGVRNVMAQGRLAVFEGRDAGPEFERRYETEQPFRDAVDEARHDRRYDPRGFEREAGEARERMQALDAARRSAPLPG